MVAAVTVTSSSSSSFSVVGMGKFHGDNQATFYLMERLKRIESDPSIRCLELANLDLDHPLLYQELQTLWEKLGPFRLERITWQDCFGGRSFRRSLFNSMPLVRQLTCCRQDLTGDEWKVDSVATAVQQDNPNNSLVQTMILEVCDVAPAALETLLSVASHSLDSFHLRRCDLDLDCIHSLERILPSLHLKCLNLHWCGLGDDAIAQLGRSLLNHPTLEEWDLAGNICRSGGMNAIRCLLMQSKTLRRLCLREQCVEDEKLDISSLVAALPYATSLQRLDISVNKLDDDDMEALPRSLSNNTTLLQLDIRSNHITDRGIHAFFSASSKMSLRKVWLQDNPSITHVGALAIRDALHYNVQLEYVGLSQEYPCSHEIDYFTSLNWGGRRLLQDTHANVALWPAVLERACKQDGMDRAANILYHLLQGGPAVLHRR